MRIQFNANSPINREVIGKILKLHTPDEVRKTRLGNYYIGKQAILNRTMADASKPNNRIVHPYGNKITDGVVGYFMGQPVKYAAKGTEYDALLEELKKILEYNDEQNENVELAKDASKFGVAYELLYLDEDASIRFKPLDPRYSLPIYSNTLDEELIYFIRYYDEDIFGELKTIEIYDAFQVSRYDWVNQEVSFRDATPHSFGMVPVAIYYNNKEEIGDYELLLSLIDSYDKLSSDNINDFEQFADAYLTLKGMDGTSGDDIAAMKENRVLLLPQEGDAQWLVKSINDTYFQNTITKLDNDIHKFAAIPNMMDEAFGSNLSGIAIKYKLIDLENKAVVKEAYFKKGLQRRIELINRILYIMGSDFNYLGIDIVFTRNLPVNEMEAVAMANQLMGLVSDETALSVLPFVSDPIEELERRNSQLDLNSVPIDNINEPQSQE